ncbi:type IV secretion system protein VirB10 [Moraxella caprae]|uniref:Type IV secretion system protein VirB10 n=2 Tax=Moraxella caprae TaxID=90240 RepID=A0A378QM98_9GAMM|nr:type IV secretion system protein VirB10 [Moraxella caprae]
MEAKLNKSNNNDIAFDEDLSDFDEHFNDPDPQPQETLDDVRGRSELEKAKKIKPKGQKALMAFLVLAGLVVCGLLFAKISSGGKPKEERKEEVKTSFETPTKKKDFGQQFEEQYIGEYDPTAAAKEEMDKPDVVESAEDTAGIAGNAPEPVMPTYEEPIIVTAPAEPAPQPAPVVAPAPPPVPELTDEEKRQERILNAGFSAMKGGGGGGGGSSAESVGGLAKQDEDPLTASLTPASLDGTAAVRMQNRDFIITKGNTIDCVLNTKFDSTVVGMITCTVTRNIYGASGRVVLIDRGSRVSGEYKGGIQQGQNRVFILWNRIETPKGVIININSPAAGSLGEAGVDGRVNTKFWQRFGGAMLVSLVNDLGKAVSEAAAEKTIGGDVRLENASETANQMATAELEKSINIPPSLIKHQGDRLSIYVARDVWFGNVYGLQTK